MLGRPSPDLIGTGAFDLEVSGRGEQPSVAQPRFRMDPSARFDDEVARITREDTGKHCRSSEPIRSPVS
jgi:hypothetical protein